MQGFTTPRRAGRRSAFTLVEMLVVVVIIGILAGLTVRAAINGIRRAREFAITQEMAQLEMALEQYKNECGEYPPDFCGVNDLNTGVQNASRAIVLRHLRTRFPKYTPGAARNDTTGTPWDRFERDVLDGTTNQLTIANVDPASALVFWLGGLPAASGSTNKLQGFSANPAYPFATAGSRTEPFFEFDETRLLPASTTEPYRFIYVPKHVSNPESGTTPPFVYFRASANIYRPNSVPSASNTAAPQVYFHQGSGLCVPYLENVDNTGPSTVYRWFSPKTFQIISTGLDGQYTEIDTSAAPANQADADKRLRYLKENGEADSHNLRPAEDDNLTSFAEGRLENEAN